MSSSVKPYKGQKYSELKQAYIKAGKLFEDPEFPASNTSLFYKNQPPGPVVWKRPREISSKAQLFVEGVSSHDLNQGMLGNCWFVAACSCLALKPDLWHQVIPDWKEQDWNPKVPQSYAGIFHFCFWIFGERLDVVVDDRLPTINGDLIYCHSSSKNEFWSALLEKAYAKLFLCYECLDGGQTGDAVVDFCGAMAEYINLKAGNFSSDQAAKLRLFDDVLKVFGKNGIICCSIEASPSEKEAHMDCGLVKGHAYGVTDIRKVSLGQEKLLMMRMQNPWGKTEWNGAWSDSSKEWQKVKVEDRKSMGLTVQDDGEFWMAFNDWCKYFTDAGMCHFTSASPGIIGKTMHFGKWTFNKVDQLNRSGGCSNGKTFLQNPQYLFDVVNPEEEVLIDLLQRDMRMQKILGKGGNLTIGFSIIKVESDRVKRLQATKMQEVVSTSKYMGSRSVFIRQVFPKGRYIVIPTTFSPGVLGDFIIRVFTEMKSSCRELLD